MPTAKDERGLSTLEVKDDVMGLWTTARSKG